MKKQYPKRRVSEEFDDFKNAARRQKILSQKIIYMR